MLYLVVALLGTGDSPQTTPARLRFRLEEQLRLPAAKADAKQIRLWAPLPNDSEGQILLEVPMPVGARLTRDPATGNRFLYFEWSAPTAAPRSLTLNFELARVPVQVGPQKKLLYAPPKASLARWLNQDRLASPELAKKLSVEVVQGADSDWEKAKKIYRHVLSHMSYDKSLPGWGQADVARACATKKGNCTDFHGLFVAMCQAQGIPARLEMGLALPTDGAAAPKPGYHCWASFFSTEHGWTPVDVSETRQRIQGDPAAAPETEFWAGFGVLSAYRVGFGRGMDAPLAPAAAAPVRYALDPVLEIDGERLPLGDPGAGGLGRAWRLAWIKE